MKHLENITIHRFRGLRDLTLQDLGEINLLVGVNNSGKTSVLEAISTYCCPLDLLAWLNTAWQREIKSSRKPQLEALKWLFPQNKDINQIDFYLGETYVSGEGNFAVKESRGFYQEIEALSLENPTTEEYLFDNLDFPQTVRGAKINLEAILKKSNNDLEEKISESFSILSNERLIINRKKRSSLLSIDIITPVSHRIEQLEVRLLSEATLQGLKLEIIKLLQVIDEEIIDLQILTKMGDRAHIYIQHKKLGFSPLSAFGDGVRRLLFMAVTLVNVRGGILLIDELETSIHTEALSKSFAWLVKSCKLMNVQLFATTHSLEAIDAMLDAIDSETDLVLYRLEQKESQMKAVRLERDRLKRLREDLGLEVRV